MNGAELVVKCLEAQGVDCIFGIPGAKVDAIFNALLDSKIRLILCRHEQNAAFMAAAYGRLTQKPGVVLVTSGPGVANLATGLLTATTEGDPVVAIGGNVPRSMHFKHSHQAADNARLMEAVAKYSVEAVSAVNIAQIIATAFKQATMPRAGACFISFPQDILSESVEELIIRPPQKREQLRAGEATISRAAALIAQAKLPILFLGEEASQPQNTQAIRTLLSQTRIATISTYQAAGVVSRELFPCFAGRVGLFCNQPGDRLLEKADVILTIGYNPVEYDPESWNPKADKVILHLDEISPEIRYAYQPRVEILGSIAENITLLKQALAQYKLANNLSDAKIYHDALNEKIAMGKTKKDFPIHPLRFIHELRQYVDDETLISCDIGTVYMWMARYFLSYQPHHLMFSNGQQTLGVALPWAMAAKLAFPNKKVISISGDGGFLFSAQELETAVREKLHFVHFVWQDGCYNMVMEQEMMKYQRASGVYFGKIDLIHYAQAFGAKGFELKSPEEIIPVLQEAQAEHVPVLINVPIDYRDNPELFAAVNPDPIH
ncbi:MULTISPECIES: acetolactate synthase AlsS [unclassified Legionella]|uniref:acetolactate synthase AlsS n=1 Tax=unclassified Legionella TaxID=2622702 RepID=UPI0010548C71|nr:acetolactate synthase AlsS [Legionella sp. W10-070]MDI9819009.1 acetolactate synthase AlsS [Legionella sp. PL877]